jgi:alanine-glyoxylate transaminase/serine-glyoxylate transaminase/serine-pyruvate transaminase
MSEPTRRFAALSPPQRLLMGPGPSQVPARVLQALAAPTVGHLDPSFLALMDELQSMLRAAFVTDNELTFAVSGTGSAGMEACLANLLEAGDHAVIGVNGVFGGRMVEIATRLGCTVTAVQAPFGQALDPDELRRALAERPAKLLAVVHAETSTGVLQDVAALASLARQAGALCVADCVTSLGGVPVRVDGWGLDAVYSGTQKCLSCPPGLSPVTFSPRAVEVLRARRTKVASWYLDASMLLQYWGRDRVYHHTAPINMLYGLREALALLLEEGLEAAHARHALHHRALAAGLQAMGLTMPVAPTLRIPQLNVVGVPEGVDEALLRRNLLDGYGIEIGSGLGPLKGKVLRIGLMGHTARRENVVTLLGALEQVLPRLGARITNGAALAAAAEVWTSPSA